VIAKPTRTASRAINLSCGNISECVGEGTECITGEALVMWISRERISYLSKLTFYHSICHWRVAYASDDQKRPGDKGTCSRARRARDHLERPATVTGAIRLYDSVCERVPHTARLIATNTVGTCT